MEKREASYIGGENIDWYSHNGKQYQFSSVAQLGLTLQDHMDSSWPGSSVHRILQVRILERVAIHSPGDLPNPGVKTSLLHCRWILYHLSHQEALMYGHVQYKINLLISCTV